jgi:hypothetical protein
LPVSDGPACGRLIRFYSFINGIPFHFTMATAFNFTRRRFLALALASAVPTLLLLTRCAPVQRRNGYDHDTYHGPFFTDGSDFIE